MAIEPRCIGLREGRRVSHKRAVGLIVLLGLGIAATGCDFWVPRKEPVPANPAVSGTLSGLDGDYATVELHSLGADGAAYGPVAPNGSWRIQGIQDDIYTVTARATGYIVQPRSYTVSVKDHQVEQPQSFDFMFSRRDPSQPTAAPTALPPGPSPTPILCTPNQPGLALGVVLGPAQLSRAGFSQSMRVEGKGFVPGERLLIVIEGHSARHGDQIESSGPPVEKDGSFGYDTSLQSDEPNVPWQLFVVHQRGVACASFVTGP
jgi:hypothetical protein